MKVESFRLGGINMGPCSDALNLTIWAERVTHAPINANVPLPELRAILRSRVNGPRGPKRISSGRTQWKTMKDQGEGVELQARRASALPFRA